MSDLSFDAALQAIRDGASCSLCGTTLIVNGIALQVSGEQFDAAWEAMDETFGDDFTVSLP